MFDGPGRPAFKRNKKTYADFPHALARSTKRLLKAFGFPHHTAPGEAEAECAVLQQAGVVDAVLSEDVDTLMFGSGMTLKNWSAEGKGSKTPTHVTVYDSVRVEKERGLTPSGMILVALMRGGDYLPEGVPGCGIKTAVEAARAGFGEDLCSLEDGDERGLREWRERLAHELETNASGWFKRRHKTMKIPVEFPNKEIYGYYKRPVVSSDEKVQRLKNAVQWDVRPDVKAMREIVRESLEWRGTGGAAKFARTFAPALLAKRCWDGDGSLNNIIKKVHLRRKHASTDGCKELRVSFVPADVVLIDKQLEEDDDKAEAAEQAGILEDEEDTVQKGKEYDPYAAEKAWMLEIFVRSAMPEMVEDWETGKTAKARPKTKKTTMGKNAAPDSETDLPIKGTLPSFFKASKPRGKMALQARLKDPNKASTPPRRKKSNHVAVERLTHGSFSDYEELSLTNLISNSPVLPSYQRDIFLQAPVHDPEPTKPYRQSPITLSSSPPPLPAQHYLLDEPPTTLFPVSSYEDEMFPSVSEGMAGPQHEDSTISTYSRSSTPPIRANAERPLETLEHSPPRGRRFSALGIYDCTHSPPLLSGHSTPRKTPTASIYDLTICERDGRPATPTKHPTSTTVPLALSESIQGTSFRNAPYSLGSIDQESLPSEPRTPLQQTLSPQQNIVRHDLTPSPRSKPAKRIEIINLCDDDEIDRPWYGDVDRDKENKGPCFKNALESPNVNCRRRRRNGLPRQDAEKKVRDKTCTEETGRLKERRSGAQERLKVMLRESLPGAWKVLPVGVEARPGSSVWEGVEIIDLTDP